VKLPSDLIEEIEEWTQLIGFDRDVGVQKLLTLGLGRAVKLQPGTRTQPMKNEAVAKSARTLVQQQADRAQERSDRMRKGQT
jgi:hypothetical protein